MLKRVTLTVLIVLGSMFWAYGCAEKKIDEADPAALFKEAEEEVKGDRFQMAIEKFRVIRNKFPYSSFSVEAAVRIADVYFLQESYIEAAGAYETFRDLHPKHEKSAYALFRIGKSYFNETPSAESRDLAVAQKAVDAYREFIKRYPQDASADEARKDLANLRLKLAKKEIYIADYYIRQQHPESARPRLEKVIELFSDTPAVEEAKQKLAKLPVVENK